MTNQGVECCYGDGSSVYDRGDPTKRRVFQSTIDDKELSADITKRRRMKMGRKRRGKGGGKGKGEEGGGSGRRGKEGREGGEREE